MTTIETRKQACAILGVSTSATADEIKKAYHKLAMKYHPDKQNGKSDEEKKVVGEKFREINEANQFLTNNSNTASKEQSNDDNTKASDKCKLECKYEVVKEMLRYQVGEEEYEKDGKYRGWWNKIDNMKTEKEVATYMKKVMDDMKDYADKKKKSRSSENSSSASGSSTSSDSSSSSSSYSSDSEGGADSGYNSASEEKKKTYRDAPITCDYCFFIVKVDDPRVCSIDKKTGKKFCSYSCFSKFIAKEVDQEQYEERMKQIGEEIQQIREKGEKNRKEHEERMRKIDQGAEERRKKREESDEEWKQKMEEREKERKGRRENFDKNLCEEGAIETINRVEFYIDLYGLSEQQANECLGSDWRKQISNSANWKEAYAKGDRYANALKREKRILDKKTGLANDKERAIDYVEWFLDLSDIEEQQLNEVLNKDWRAEINACSNEKEVERKKNSLERKIKKISNDPNRKKGGLVDNLNYSQQARVQSQLALSPGQSLKEYIRSAKTPEERKQREDEIRVILSRFEQENTKTRAVNAIVGICVIGAIIGLIIYLVKRNKNK